MLDLDPAKLVEEVNAADRFRAQHTSKMRAIMQRFIGNWYRDDSDQVPVPENLIFSYVAFMLPQLASASPSVRVAAVRAASHKAIADAMQMALRRWASATELASELQDVARDALTGFGVMKVGLEPRQTCAPGAEGTQPQGLQPFAVRIAPTDFIMDPLCKTPDAARFMGHRYFKDIAEFTDHPERWDPKAVERLSSVTVTQPANAPGELALPIPRTADRKQVELVDLWIAEQGVLITIARHGGSAEPIVLRQEQYWGPPEGPYEVFGFYRVGEDPFPLAPLAAVMDQFEELQAHGRQASDEASSYKRFGLVEATAEDMKNAVMNATSGDVYPVQNITGNFVQVELGGSPPGRLQHMVALRERFDRTIGMSDAQRGVAGGKTATENTIVESNADERTGFMKGGFNHHVQRVMRRAGWYMYYTPSVVMEVNHTDPLSGQQVELDFLGGVQPGQEDAHWLMFNLTIEPESMSRADDQVLLNRALETKAFAQEIAELMVTMPWVNWRSIVQKFGDATQQPDLADTLFNPQMQAQAMGGGMMAGGGMPGGGAPDPMAALTQNDPRMGIGGPRPGWTPQMPQGDGAMAGAPVAGGGAMFGGGRGPMPAGPRSRGGGGGGAMFGGRGPTAQGGPRSRGAAPMAGGGARSGGPMPMGPRARLKLNFGGGGGGGRSGPLPPGPRTKQRAGGGAGGHGQPMGVQRKHAPGPRTNRGGKSGLTPATQIRY